MTTQDRVIPIRNPEQETIERLRKALAECTASLQEEMLQKFDGKKPEDMHPVTRRSYDRDMVEIEGYKAILKEG